MAIFIECNKCSTHSDCSIEILRGSGILKRLQENMFSKLTSDTEVRDPQATLEDVLPILMILFCGILASIFCLLAEICFFRLKNHFTNQRFS